MPVYNHDKFWWYSDTTPWMAYPALRTAKEDDNDDFQLSSASTWYHFYLIIIIICYVVFIAFNINHSSILPLMALNSLYYADVPLSNYSTLPQQANAFERFVLKLRSARKNFPRRDNFRGSNANREKNTMTFFFSDRLKTFPIASNCQKF